MHHAAKRKSSLTARLTALRLLLLLVVACCGLETRVWSFAATPQLASGEIAFATPSFIGEIYDAVAYDASDSLVAAKRVGSGPAKGFLEVSDAYASSKAVQNFGSARPTDFIFDAQSQRFIMGRGPLGHDSVLQAGRIAPSETTVGGRIFRQDGRLITDEWSGHYGQNWTPELRQQFQNFMQQHGVDITHTPWGQ